MTPLILICIVLLLATVAFIVKIQPKGRHVSISQHAASKWWIFILFGTSLTIFGSLLLLFLYTSFGPNLKVPIIFYIFLVITWVCLILTAWIPDKGKGKLSRIHWVTSLSLASMMTLITASLIFAQQITMVTQIMAALTTIWFCYTLCLFFFVKNSHQHFLVYQTVNIIAFFAVIGTGILIG